MGETTKIEWTHHTFNPWIGCTKVHAGCTNCYAEAQNGRWNYNGGTWGKGAPRKVTSDANWKQPLKWARDAAKAGERRRVFCASLADVLDEEAPREAQQRLWQLIRETAHVCSAESNRLSPCNAFGTGVDSDGECAACGKPVGGLHWLLLTKRPERWQLIPEDVRPLVWLGTSISDQETARRMVPWLLDDRANFAKRFLSIEPQVGPVNLLDITLVDEIPPHGPRCFMNALTGHIGGPDEIHPRTVDWVIVGGESGPGARPFNLDWARSLHAQCAAACVAFFCKQLGASPRQQVPPSGAPDDGGDLVPLALRDRKGGDWSEWPGDLRVRQFPEVDR